MTSDERRVVHPISCIRFCYSYKRKIESVKSDLHHFYSLFVTRHSTKMPYSQS